MRDALTKSPEKGGFDFGTIGSSGILGALLLIFVAVEHFRWKRAMALDVAG